MLTIKPLQEWCDKLKLPLVIAGPCSAENETQVLQTAHELAKNNQVSVFRAGVWKPRTRPGNFEGAGKPALKWLQRVKQETGLLTITEVATPQHVQMALEAGVDMVWIGARTTTNPFLIEHLASALAGADIPVLIKNPITPDLDLWMGAIERFSNAGITKLAAIHRGFFPYEHSNTRNTPKWELAIDLKSNFPNLPIINDPSHIAGKKSLVHEIAQHALNLSFDGLMVEVHNKPENALSDRLQQLNPAEFALMMSKLTFPSQTSGNTDYMDFIELTRGKIDSIDEQILELLANRMQLVEQIGVYKRSNNVTIVQLRRWENNLKARIEQGSQLGLSEAYIKSLFMLVHNESIKRQSEIIQTESQQENDD